MVSRLVHLTCIIMHCHLKECIVDAGPIYTFWCFSFERYNGLLGAMNKSWSAPEQQLIHKFHNLQMLASVILPDNTPNELVCCFQNAKDYRTSLPDVIINSIYVLQYEQNIFCLPQNIKAHKHDFHYPVVPGKETLMTEPHREALRQMYCAFCVELIVLAMSFFVILSLRSFNRSTHPLAHVQAVHQQSLLSGLI